jgi:hypothetical protein
MIVVRVTANRSYLRQWIGKHSSDLTQAGTPRQHHILVMAIGIPQTGIAQ